MTNDDLPPDYVSAKSTCATIYTTLFGLVEGYYMQFIRSVGLLQA